MDSDQKKENKISAIADFIKTLDKSFPEKVIITLLADEGLKEKLSRTD